MSGNIEVLARGVCVVDGQVLLCQGTQSKLFYLPGGHVEFRETARQALMREMHEELGIKVEIGRFIGCCEHAFSQKGEVHAEINLLFEMRIPDLALDAGVISVEDWIAFQWQSLSRLDEVLLEPAPLRKVLTKWIANPGGHVVSGDTWA